MDDSRKSQRASPTREALNLSSSIHRGTRESNFDDYTDFAGRMGEAHPVL